MENVNEMLGHFFTHVQERASLYTVVILIFCYYFLFEKDLPCTCENLNRDCSLYMILPTLIILFALLVMDKHSQRALSHKRWWSALFRFCHAVCQSDLDRVVLIDGDWMVCCADPSHHNISCEDEDKRSEEDRRILNGLKDKSRIYGLSLLLVVFILAFAAALIQKISKCSKKDYWHEIVLEEEEKFVPEKKREVAKLMLLHKLKSHIPEGEWMEFFSVGDEVITAGVPPSLETLCSITTAVPLTPAGGAAGQSHSAHSGASPVRAGAETDFDNRTQSESSLLLPKL